MAELQQQQLDYVEELLAAVAEEQNLLVRVSLHWDNTGPPFPSACQEAIC